MSRTKNETPNPNVEQISFRITPEQKEQIDVFVAYASFKARKSLSVKDVFLKLVESSPLNQEMALHAE